jgi:hypothetical protein
MVERKDMLVRLKIIIMNQQDGPSNYDRLYFDVVDLYDLIKEGEI